MVRQFADRYAFLRELVQNGIDAGATRIDVRFERRDDGAVVTSVEDDGCGMSRATIEGPLITLFSSSKENDKTKIGKYGIGFVSVFALEPEVVEVTTWRDGAAWLIRFYTDHSYELSSAPARDGHGTVVVLLGTMDLTAFQAHVELGKIALRRWCRHARVPVAISVVDSGDPAAGNASTVNVPFGLGALVAIDVREGNDHFVLGVGPVDDVDAKPKRFCGYYNRGLTLFEHVHDDDALGDVRFKVDSPQLSHTISRDNVRRDAELDRIHERIRALAQTELATELVARCAAIAEEVAAGSEPRARDLAALFSASIGLPFRDVHKKLALPLVEPIGGRRTMTLEDVMDRSNHRVVIEEAPSPVTAALARSGTPVVRGSAPLAVALRVITDEDVNGAAQAFACATKIEHTPTDEALTTAVTTLLREAGRGLAETALATFVGIGHDDTFRVAAAQSSTIVVRADRAAERRWGRTATLLVNADSAIARLARKRASDDPGLAAHLVCRMVLLAEGPLDAGIVDRLLEIGPHGPPDRSSP